MLTRTVTALAIALATLAGCDTIQSDFSQFTESFSPPTPAEAAQWAADPNDRENARRGTVLLANAPWGGAAPYLKMYRLYAEDSLDPLVRAAALQALGRHGDASDAALVAKSLSSPFRQARLAAAKALQRLHDPSVADTLWPRLVDRAEDSDVRTEIAIALGQYATPAVFQALVAALSQRELAVNIASLDSLRMLTGQNFGLEEDEWLNYYASTSAPFASGRTYIYPTFVRELDVWDHIVFWMPTVFESPNTPIGLKTLGARRTDDTPEAPTTPPAPAPTTPETGADKPK